MLFLLVSWIPLTIGCNKETYAKHEQFTLDFNKTATVRLDGVTYTIKFVELIEDSRCPPDVYCHWMGQVAVKLRLNDETDLQLGHHTSIAASGTYQNHEVQLLGVNYDKKKNFGKEKHCRLTVRID